MIRRRRARGTLPWGLVARIAFGAAVSASGCSSEEPAGGIEPAIGSPPRTFPTDDAATPQAPPLTPIVPAACAPGDPFVSVTAIALGESAVDTSPRLTPDELTLYFSSEREGGRGALDLYEAKRATPDAPFAAPRPLTALATTADERDPAPSADGLLLVYSSGDEVRVARREDREAIFTASDEVDGVKPGARHPFRSITPSALWVAAPGESGERIFVAGFAETGALEPAQLALGLSTSGAQRNPALSADGRELFFAASLSDGGAPDAGALDGVVSALRARADGAFAPAAPVSGLPPGAEPGWPSLDGCRLYFSAPRVGAGRSVFVASRRR